MQGNIKNFKVSVPQHRAHTQMKFEKLKSIYTASHKVYTQRKFEKSQSFYTPQHRAHTQGKFKKFQSLYTPTAQVRKNSKFPVKGYTQGKVKKIKVFTQYRNFS